jgi:hypothetical protein
MAVATHEQETTMSISSTQTSDEVHTIPPFVTNSTVPNQNTGVTTTGIHQKYLDRGSNFWFAATSGCGVTVWVFNTGPRMFRDCFWDVGARSRTVEGRPHLVQANDTIYVPTHFIHDFFHGPLASITVPIVVLSGQYGFSPRAKNLGRKPIMRQFLEHPLVMKWMVQNPDLYLDGLNVSGYQDKVSALPFGLQKDHYAGHTPKPRPEVVFREAFQRHLQLPVKTKGVLYGYINNYTSVGRQRIPSGDKLPLDQFYDELAKSRFVVSPGGDRPDCYRNFEALAFGAIPITDLDPSWYRFFRGGPMVFNTTDWVNLTEDRVLTSMKVEEFPGTNRNIVFEEYWLEYIDTLSGMPLRWWDRVGRQAAYLADFANYTVDR